MDVVGEAETSDEVLNILGQNTVDVVFLDLKLCAGQAEVFFTKAFEISPGSEIIALSSNIKKFDMHLSLAYGVSGYLSNQARGEDYLRAVRSVVNGYAFLPSEYIDDIRETYRRISRTGNMYGLSEREIEVLHACKDGRTAQQVADALDISVRTVETHRSSIYKKTECRNLNELQFLFDEG